MATDEPVCDPTFDPSGRRLALALADGIAILDLDTGELRRVTRIDGDTRPSWSPDGTALGFLRGDVPMVVPATGGSPSRIGDRRAVALARRP